MRQVPQPQGLILTLLQGLSTWLKSLQPQLLSTDFKVHSKQFRILFPAPWLLSFVLFYLFLVTFLLTVFSLAQRVSNLLFVCSLK